MAGILLCLRLLRTQQPLPSFHMASNQPAIDPAAAAVPVVVNRHAGAIATHSGRLRLTAAARSRSWLEAVQQTGRQPLWLLEPDEVPRKVEALLAAGVRRVAVGGGDGTLAAVVPLFLRHDAECVCLPLGTLNHFARDLGIDLEPETWDDLLLSGRVRAVDVGQVNGRTFLNNVSVGLYPRMIRQRARLEGEKLLGSKRLASLWATLQVLRSRLQTFTVQWHADEDEGRFDTNALLVASNALGRHPYAPRDPDALQGRQLVLFAPQALGVLDLARMASYALAGNIIDCPGIDVVVARTIELHLPIRTVAAAVDGELIQLRTPIRIDHHERRLQAVVHDR
jgi:diacylglycerol kinase family enzyme